MGGGVSYWSSTTYSDTKGAWIIDINVGYVCSSYEYLYGYSKDTSSYVWPVRNGQTSNAPAQLPKTGQITCYDSSGNVISCTGSGQDGELQKGVAWPDPRFTVNGDCVTDNLTGLVWMKSPDSTTKMWTDAITYSNNLSLCGYTDWRLPNVNELESLVNAGQADTASWLNSQGFSNVQPDYYWTSTTYAFGTNFAYVVNIYDGKMLYYGSKTISYNYTYLYYVWPVRGGQ